jgi:CheY-like chemotaxis protein
VDDAAGMEKALEEEPWDVVLCDYRMPDFGVFPALKILAERGLDLPFIAVSGVIGEEVAVQMLQAGAHDYIMKDRLLRLAPAIEREMGQAQSRRDRAQSLRKAAWLAAVVDSLAEGGHRHGFGGQDHQLERRRGRALRSEGAGSNRERAGGGDAAGVAGADAADFGGGPKRGAGA